jgi:hypothetical protein
VPVGMSLIITQNLVCCFIKKVAKHLTDSNNKGYYSDGHQTEAKKLYILLPLPLKHTTSLLSYNIHPHLRILTGEELYTNDNLYTRTVIEN